MTKPNAIFLTIIQAFIMSYFVWCEIANCIHPGPFWHDMTIRDWYLTFGLTALCWGMATAGVWSTYLTQKEGPPCP